MIGVIGAPAVMALRVVVAMVANAGVAIVLAVRPVRNVPRGHVPSASVRLAPIARPS